MASSLPDCTDSPKELRKYYNCQVVRWHEAGTFDGDLYLFGPRLIVGGPLVRWR